VFALNTNGTAFSTLHSFTARTQTDFTKTNSDGARPSRGLIRSGNILYGTAYVGGSFGLGTVFALNTDGTGFTNLHSFTGGTDGSRPQAGLTLSGNTLYGTAYWDGIYGGTVFSLSFSPQLAVTRSGTTVVLTWPTNYAGFDYSGFTLESTTNPSSPVWTTNHPAPVVINGQFTVTNPISGTQQFFRSSQ
jgi:uncharacterized repeat protein (TIGR03803 family)